MCQQPKDHATIHNDKVNVNYKKQDIIEVIPATERMLNHYWISRVFNRASAQPKTSKLFPAKEEP